MQRVQCDIGPGRRGNLRSVLICALSVAALASPLAEAAPHDVVVVLDNSGSMRQNDPNFLAKEAVRQFVGQATEETRIGIVIFDSTPRLVQPLSEVESTDFALADSLAQVDYRGQLTNIPSAIERAIYHLRLDGREDALRSILFLTDGKVDTGDPEQDRDMERWLREELSQMAASDGIRIFGIAFTEAADFIVIQTLAQRTGGEYMRALDPAELPEVFRRMDEIMSAAAEPESAAPTGVSEPAPEPSAEASSQQDTAQEPAPSGDRPAADAEAEDAPAEEGGDLDRLIAVLAEQFGRQNALIVGGGLFMVLLLVGMYLWFLRSRRGADDSLFRKAHLADTSGVTGTTEHRLGESATVIGRKAAPEEKGVASVVIDRSTVSRRHAVITYEDFNYWISDQGTTNGTYVNDVRIQDKVRLRHGDKIRFENFVFEFRFDDQRQDDDRTVLAGAEEFDDDATVMSGADEALAPAPQSGPEASGWWPDEGSGSEPASAPEPASPAEAATEDEEEDLHDARTVMFDDEELRKRMAEEEKKRGD